MSRIAIAPVDRAWALGLALIVLAGVAVRLSLPVPGALWLDEAYSAWNSALSWRDLWTITPQFETHPPLYYSILKLWRGAAGDDVAALRALSMITSLATLGVVMLAGRSAGRLAGLADRELLIATLAPAAFLALSPLAIDLSWQARPYGLYMLAAVGALLAALRLIEAGGSSWWLAYLAALELTLWLHSLGALFAACLALGLMAGFAGTGRLRAALPAWFAVHLVAGLLYLPCLIMVIGYSSAWTKGSWLFFDWFGVPSALAQTYSAQYLISFALGFVLSAMALAGLAATARGRTTASVLGVAAFGPFALATLLSAAVAPVLLPRTISPVTAYFGILLGVGLAPLCRKSMIVPAMAALLLASMAVRAVRTPLTGAEEDWTAIVASIEARRVPGDVVWVYPNEVSLPLDLAYAARPEGAPPMRALPARFPALGVPGDHPSGVPAVPVWSRGKLDVLVRREHPQVRGRIWLVRRLPQLYDENDAMSAALGALRRRSTRIDFGDVVVEVFES